MRFQAERNKRKKRSQPREGLFKTNRTTLSCAHCEASVVQERSKKSKEPIVTTITDALDIDLTKRGVLAALNLYAAHPDKF
jgi:hypothetical protein